MYQYKGIQDLKGRVNSQSAVLMDGRTNQQYEAYSNEPLHGRQSIDYQIDALTGTRRCAHHVGRRIKLAVMRMGLPPILYYTGGAKFKIPSSSKEGATD